MRADILTIKEILNSGHFDRLHGFIENEVLECKGQPYNLAIDFHKRELAKDVSSFANSDGGIIVIGARTTKSHTHLGDEIEAMRPMEQNLLDVEQYHKTLQDWVYPRIQKVDIRFFMEAESQKGIFAIEIPSQDEALKPFLIKRLIEGQKIVETVFGFAERRRSNSEVMSVVNLQSTLRSGFHHEKLCLDSLPVFREESPQARHLATARPLYWELLLAADLMRTRFKQLRLALNDISNDAILRKHRFLTGREFFTWQRSKWPEAQAAITAISTCINNELPQALASTEEHPADPEKILNAINRLYAGGKALVEWEADVKCVHPPERT